MTPDEKIQKIKAIEQEFLAKIDSIKGEYQAKVKELVASVEQTKIANLKKELGI